MVFLVRVTSAGQTDYRFLKSLEANAAYWRGARDNWICPLRFAINRGGPKKENAARKASVNTFNIGRDGSSCITNGEPEYNPLISEVPV